ncbi:aldo/keto reductase [Streptomyces sp. NPDC005500]|uniref:aldo/keto reductase n=1 Tax=Streptomyces sp. NPDC005500 TaxID=3155007 RepID=UPI0033B4BA44
MLRTWTDGGQPGSGAGQTGRRVDEPANRAVGGVPLRGAGCVTYATVTQQHGAWQGPGGTHRRGRPDLRGDREPRSTAAAASSCSAAASHRHTSPAPAAGGPGPLLPTGPAGGGARRRSHRHGRRLRLRRLEDILRKALHPYPDRLLVATKVGQMQPRPGAWVPVDRPAHLRHQCEMSLRRLGVDRIDLLHLHRLNPDAPFAGRMKSTRSSRKQTAWGAQQAGPRSG